MKNLILILSALVVFTGCKNDQTESTKPTNPTHELHKKSATLYNRHAEVMSENFIAGYIIPDQMCYIIEPIPIIIPGMESSFPPMDDEDWTLANHSWKLDSLEFLITLNKRPRDNNYINNVCLVRSANAKPGGPAKFTELAQRYNDTNYHGGYWVDNVNFSPMKYLTVVCDKDFDAKHPAGTPLDDIITVNYYSAQKFIESEYSDMDAGDGYTGFKENLAKLNTLNINLYTSGFTLIFDKGPEIAGEYQFKVQFQNADRLTLGATLPLIRLKKN